MDSLKAKSLANELNELACKGCTEGWLEKHDGLSDPIQDINECGSLGFISPERQERLINEVKEEASNRSEKYKLNLPVS